MRLLIDCTPLWAGGGVQVAIAFLETVKSKDTVEWVAAVPDQMLHLLPPSIAADSRILAFKKASHLDRVKLRLKMTCVEKAVDPDVVFTIFGPPYFRAHAPHVGGFALPRMIYPLPGSGRRSIMEKVLNVLRARMLRKLDHIVVETDTVKDRLSRVLRLPTSHISVIGNCVNPLVARVHPVPRQKTGVTGILTPSVHYAHKNLEIIPHVAAAIQSQRPDLDFEFRLTLPGQSSAWKRISHAAERLGIVRRIVTLGHLDLCSLGDEYARADIIFLPTLLEASTAVYPESFHFQRPVVTSDIDFARDLCGNAAIFVDPNNGQSAAESIVRLVEDASLYKDQVKAGIWQLATKYPSPERKFEMQMALLEAIANARRRTEYAAS